jgi:hypothetical protein
MSYTTLLSKPSSVVKIILNLLSFQYFRKNDTYFYVLNFILLEL